jgi:hypothetical protein
LAQANRDRSASGGRRVDETGFDQRMQAIRRMLVTLGQELINRRIESDTDETFLLRNFSRESNGNEEEEVKLVDPLKWYGIIVPQSLKNAQARFIQGRIKGKGY